MPGKIVIDPRTDALLLVDVQDAFMSGGGLAVADAEAILPVIERLRPRFDLFWASVDRHPKGHVSLASSYTGYAPMSLLTIDEVLKWDAINKRIGRDAKFELDELRRYLKRVQVQVLWPDHALADSGEDELRPEIADLHQLKTVVKGMDPACDSYSAFNDNLKRPTGLAEDMESYGVKRVFLCGLAEDFCVGWSALDAVDAGFEAYVISDATRPVNTPPSGDDPGSVARIRQQFAEAGVTYVGSEDLSSF